MLGALRRKKIYEVRQKNALVWAKNQLSSGARTLPIRLGGFGLRSVVRTSSASYWSGLAQAGPDILASSELSASDCFDLFIRSSPS